MTKEAYILAVLECNFAGFKDEIIEAAVKKILEHADEGELRKHGQWIPLEKEIGLYECSICGHKILREECNYCPNCGARMDEERIIMMSDDKSILADIKSGKGLPPINS